MEMELDRVTELRRSLCTENTAKIAVLDNSVKNIKEDVADISSDVKEIAKIIFKYETLVP